MSSAPRVLVVEDSPTQLERLRLLLEGEGYQVDVAGNGREGLERVRVAAPDLVISDVVMPEIDGYAFCEAIKSAEGTRRIPVILFTEQQDPRDILEGLLRGADNFIPKAAAPEYLLERVRRILKQLDYRRHGRMEVEFVVRVGERDVTLSADKQQIFELMISSLEETSRVNDRLRDSQRLLEERAEQLASVNRELEAFSYSVSHDLRAPLRHISGYAHILREKNLSLDDAARGHLEKILRAAERMGRLIDDLLSFSRLGRADLRGSRVDVEQLASDVTTELREQDPDREVSVQIGTLPVVSADPAMLRVVLTNLIGNAMKYTRNQSHAEIQIGSLPEGEGHLVVFVRDNGAGFDMQHADRLFGVFQRLHRDEEYEGTGIGLATVRRIVERHGGRTWAEGVVGEGATFYFSLPVWRATAVANPAPGAQQPLGDRIPRDTE
jgi:hypothetical protein